jgi:hypothetical protein
MSIFAVIPATRGRWRLALRRRVARPDTRALKSARGKQLARRN